MVQLIGRNRILYNYLKRKAKKNPRCLSVGCSIAEPEQVFAKLLPRLQIEGIDYDPDLIKKGQNKRVKLQAMDATKMKFPDNSFDIIWSMDVLEHIPTRKEVMKEIYRVLKPGGTLIVSLPYHHPIGNLFDTGHWRGLHKRFSTKRAKRLVQEFKVRRIQRYGFIFNILFSFFLYLPLCKLKNLKIISYNVFMGLREVLRILFFPFLVLETNLPSGFLGIILFCRKE